MAKASASTVQFQPVDTGDMSEIPPDLPAGAWEAQCSVKKAKTSKDSYPMLILEWRTTKALTDGNEDSEGGKAADFLVFWPANAPASRMARIRLKGMCAALGIDVPSATSIKTWDDVADFIEELEGLKAQIYTKVEIRKDTGEQTTKILYTAPGGLKGGKSKAAAEDDEEDEEPVKKSKVGPNGRPMKKKAA